MTLEEWLDKRWMIRSNLQEWKLDLLRAIRLTKAIHPVIDLSDPTQGSEGPTDLMQERIDDDRLGRFERAMVAEAFIRQGVAMMNWCQENIDKLDSFNEAFAKQDQDGMARAEAFLDALTEAYDNFHRGRSS